WRTPGPGHARTGGTRDSTGEGSPRRGPGGSGGRASPRSPRSSPARHRPSLPAPSWRGPDRCGRGSGRSSGTRLTPDGHGDGRIESIRTHQEVLRDVPEPAETPAPDPADRSPRVHERATLILSAAGAAVPDARGGAILALVEASDPDDPPRVERAGAGCGGGRRVVVTGDAVFQSDGMSPTHLIV